MGVDWWRKGWGFSFSRKPRSLVLCSGGHHPQAPREKYQAPHSGESCILSTLTLSSAPPMRKALGSSHGLCVNLFFIGGLNSMQSS